jgi:hypothetical protein
MAALLASPAQSRSKAADYLIRDQIAGACETGKGKIDGNAVIERDLTGDGQADLIISHTGITCSDGGGSNACGAQVCSFIIYVRDGALLKSAKDDLLGMMVTVGDGKVPAIRWRGHGGGARSIKWNGREFR